MAPQRPQLDSQTLHQVRWLLGGLLSLLAAWTVFYMEVDAVVLLAVATVAVPLATWRPGLAASVPGWAHRLAFPAIFAIFAMDFYQTREPLPVMIRLGLMLLIYRSVTLRSRREDLQLILLALFLVVVAGVLTVSMVFVLQILVFTGCALALMLSITLTDAAEDKEEMAGGKPAWVRVEWGGVMRRLLAVADWRVLTLGSVLFTAVLGLSALLFLMIPRFDLGTNFFLDQMLKGKSSRSGFSETVSFGDVVKIQQDRGLALSVDISDPSQVPPTPYWRMLVLDEYIFGGFNMSAGLRAESSDPSEKKSRHNGTVAPTAAEAPVWTIYLESGVSKYLPLVGPYERITFASPQILMVNRTQVLATLQNDPSKMTAYRVEGMLPTARFEDVELAKRLVGWTRPEPKTAVNDYNPDEFGMEREQKSPMYLNLNLKAEEIARLRDWVQEIGAPKAGDREGFVRRACAWLERRHGYSLSMELPPGEGDNLVRWLASPQPGHCELFAGALVLLCRAADVPARMVVGFKGGVWNAGSGSITVTNADAHAWCEIYDGERYWLRADPTPGAGGLSSAVPPPPASLAGGAPRLEVDTGWSAKLNGLKVFWYRQIVSFDQKSQLELVRSAGKMAQSYGKRLLAELDRRLRSAGQWLSSPWSLGRVGWAVGALFAGGVLVWGWRRINVVALWRAMRGVDPVRREAGRWLRRMSTKGVPEDDAVRAELLRLRYGSRSTWAPSAGVFRAARETLKAWSRRSPR